MTDPTTMTADEIEKLVAAATPGRWRVRTEGHTITDDAILIAAAPALALRLANVLRYVDELERDIRQTHVNHCDESWTGRGLHAPDCLLYALEAQQ